MHKRLKLLFLLDFSFSTANFVLRGFSRHYFYVWSFTL
jgi:hypothetical protein